MRKQELLQEVSSLLARFVAEVRISNAMSLFDINRLSEDVLAPILGEVLDCPNLTNQNKIQMNFPAVDLGCSASKTSIQITSDPTSAKLVETLTKFKKHDLAKDYDRLIVYNITEKQQRYSSRGLDDAIRQLSIPFDPEKNVLDYRDIATILGGAKEEKVETVVDYLRRQFAKSDQGKKFRSHLDRFLAVSYQEIEVEKKAKKYIPSVFIETTEIKEQTRYFANPMFFHRKIDEMLRKINSSRFSSLLKLAHIDELDVEAQALADLAPASNLTELHDRLADQNTAIDRLKSTLEPFSWYGDRGHKFSPNAEVKGYWDVLGHSIQSQGAGLFRALDEASDYIALSQKRIFLITGMAGQGKTNFVCDLIENQFRKFEVPTVFVPARKLNAHPGPSRILTYLLANRYAPKVDNINDLIGLFESIASEVNKPFIIVIDGLNEVRDIEGLSYELQVLFHTICQYKNVKIIVTCRSEFYEFRYGKLFEPEFSDETHWVRDLRKEMTEKSKSRLLKAYLTHFGIDAELSSSARKFLKDDLILLRIFCDIHAGASVGFVADIYKGDVFEQYLTMKLRSFERESQRPALNILYSLVNQMLNSGSFAQVSLAGFDAAEMAIVDALIGEDIILRREVPSSGLDAIGAENVSFTYDEMRDFLIAFYLTGELFKSSPHRVWEILKQMNCWPSYEGVFRYLYVLSRKRGLVEVREACEAFPDFQEHYLNNLTLLSSDIQTDADVERVSALLNGGSSPRDAARVAWILFWKRNEGDRLSIVLLLDHLRGLGDEALGKFLIAMFSEPGDYKMAAWKKRLGSLLESFLRLDDKVRSGLGEHTVATLIHFAPYGPWDVAERMANLFEMKSGEDVLNGAALACATSKADSVQRFLAEIKGREVNG